MVTDLAEVYRLGTAKAEENVAFRRYLAAHHANDSPFQILATEIEQHIDCTQCANCCRHSIVEVNAAEIGAIARRVGITVEAAVQRYTVPDSGAPALRQLRSGDAGCIFLRGNLCEVYSARPRACRDFPNVSIGCHSLGARPSSLGRWAAMCPIIFNAIESYKHAVGFHGGPRAH